MLGGLHMLSKGDSRGISEDLVNSLQGNQGAEDYTAESSNLEDPEYYEEGGLTPYKADEDDAVEFGMEVTFDEEDLYYEDGGLSVYKYDDEDVLEFSEDFDADIDYEDDDTEGDIPFDYEATE